MIWIHDGADLDYVTAPIGRKILINIVWFVYFRFSANSGGVLWFLLGS